VALVTGAASGIGKAGLDGFGEVFADVKPRPSAHTKVVFDPAAD